MLPKPDKSKKNAVSVEQLDLVNTISADDKIHSKRRLLIIILVLTFGASFSFWLYTSLKKIPFPGFNFHPSLPKISVPNLSFRKTFNPNIDEIINKDDNKWSVYLYIIPSNFNWSKNYSLSTPAPIIDGLSKLTANQDSITKSALPEGVKIQEKVVEDVNYFEVQALISPPQKQFLFLIKVEGNNLTSSISLIPSLVRNLYWAAIENDR